VRRAPRFSVTAKQGYWAKFDEMTLGDFDIYVKQIDTSSERWRMQTHPGLAAAVTKMTRAAAALA